GTYSEEVNSRPGKIVIGGQEINVLSEKDPEKLPWRMLEIDVVIESTGFFIRKADAEKHLLAGAKQVIISAPSPDKEVPTIVLGVNDDKVDLTLPVLSNASCTTNNVAPLVKILDENWGIIDG